MEKINSEGMAEDVTPLIEHDTYDDLIKAAQAEASSTLSQPIPGLIYQQAGRQFIATSFPLALLVKSVKLDTLRKGDDPNEHINRPLMPEHVRSIVQYLTTQPEYILPGITLSVRQPLRCHVMKGDYPVKLGQVILPYSIQFAVTDGQHRIKALEEAMHQRPDIGRDGIAVTIIPEMEIDKIHQDFVDCAQVKPIPPALLTVFNQRDPLARLSRSLIDKVPVFKGRIEKIGKTVGKNSINLFTMNQVRAGIAEVLTGDSMMAGPQLKKAVEERLTNEAATEYHSESIVRFYQWFTEANPEWNRIGTASTSPERDRIDASELRQQFISFTATGLVIMGRIGYTILKLDSEQQHQYAARLASFNWRRDNPIWTGNVVQGDGKIMTLRGPVETAIAKVKQAIGLTLTEKDLGRLSSSENNLFSGDERDVETSPAPPPVLFDQA